MDIYPYGFRIRKDHWIGCWPWNVLREDVESRSSEYRLKMMAGLYVRLDENWVLESCGVEPDERCRTRDRQEFLILE